MEGPWKSVAGQHLQMLHACGHPLNIYHYERLPATNACVLHLWRSWRQADLAAAMDPPTMAEVRQWPTFNYASANLFRTKKQRKKLGEERRRGRAVRRRCGTRQERETKVTIVSNCAEASVASFDIGPLSHQGTIRAQPMRVATLHRCIVVDASNLLDPDTAISDRSCSSSFGANESSRRIDSNASTSAATPTSTSTRSSESPVSVKPLVKNFRRRGIPSKPTVKVECINVDDASSSTPLHLYFEKVTITQPIRLTVHH